ncbi:GNAT family N-acetyltransferase [Chryseobacterium arthrosphaerae]|nr:GNAT family N-acetyltransferase [Chryseobacterium arthrosphaerae]WES98195.1 GNAT family N-acetyltransferase [Chryseobacterium arthrosphaerae]
MAIYRIISGKKGWIEDVSVDENYRGMEIGRRLINNCLPSSAISNGVNYCS